MSDSTCMDLAKAFEQVVAARRSVRGFKKEAVADNKLKALFELAQKAPSNCNTQPWITHVVSGDKLEELRTLLPENTLQGKMSFDYPYNGSYQGEYKKRQYDAAQQLYGAVGLKREDKAGRQKWFMENYRFFGAPHVAFLFLPEAFGLREAMDCGMYAQTLMLAMTAFGIASCPQTSLGFHAGAVKDVLGIDNSHKLLFGISFGYEDPDEPVNRARVGRAPLEQTTFFHS